MAPDLLDLPGYDTWLARRLVEAGRLRPEQLARSLASPHPRGGAVTLARRLVALGLLEAGEARRLLGESGAEAEEAQRRRRLGPFLLGPALGAGGMGAVYRAEDGQGRPCAVKVLPLAGDAELALRFEREARALELLRGHPQVIEVLGAGREGGVMWLAMELAEGGSLAERLRRGPLAPRAAAALVRDLARGLAWAHGRGVLHRDLKPANVLFDRAGTPKLADFGLAQLAGVERLTASGVLVGSPAYMAPEQATLGGVHDARTDVYGLGTVLYQALTGRAPFQAPDWARVLAAVVAEPPQPPRALVREVDPALEAIALRCLAKEPGERFPDALGLEQALTAWLEGRSGSRRGGRPWLAAAVLLGGVASSLGLLLAAPRGAAPGRGPSSPPAPAPRGDGWEEVARWTPGEPGPVPREPELWGPGPVRVADPLGPARGLRPGDSSAAFAGALERLEGERVRVRYRAGAWAGPVYVREPGKLLASSRRAGWGEAGELLAPNDGGELYLSLGRARWRGAGLTLEMEALGASREGYDDYRLMVLHLGERGSDGETALNLCLRAGTMASGTHRGAWLTSNRPLSRFPGRLALRPGSAPALELDGVAITDLQATLASPASDGPAVMRGCELGLGVREVTLEGVPLRGDRPALAWFPAELPGRCRFGAEFSWEPDPGAGGPCLALGDPAGPHLLLELVAGRLRLTWGDDVLAEQALARLPARGRLELVQEVDRLRGTLREGTSTLAELSCLDPLPRGGPSRAGLGSSGWPVELGAALLERGPADPLREAWDRDPEALEAAVGEELGRRRLQLPARAGTRLPSDPEGRARLRWYCGAQALDRLWRNDRRERGWRELPPQVLPEFAEHAASCLEEALAGPLDEEVRRDAEVRLLLLGVVLGRVEQVGRAAEELCDALGAAGAMALLDGVFGQGSLSQHLAEGLGLSEQLPGARAAALEVAWAWRDALTADLQRGVRRERGITLLFQGRGRLERGDPAGALAVFDQARAVMDETRARVGEDPRMASRLEMDLGELFWSRAQAVQASPGREGEAQGELTRAAEHLARARHREHSDGTYLWRLRLGVARALNDREGVLEAALGAVARCPEAERPQWLNLILPALRGQPDQGPIGPLERVALLLLRGQGPLGPVLEGSSPRDTALRRYALVLEGGAPGAGTPGAGALGLLGPARVREPGARAELQRALQEPDCEPLARTLSLLDPLLRPLALGGD